MPLVRWNPGSDLLNLHSELDRVFNELIPGPAGLPQAAEMARAAILPLDIRRDGDKLVIEAAVPGLVRLLNHSRKVNPYACGYRKCYSARTPLKSTTFKKTKRTLGIGIERIKPGHPQRPP